MKEKYYQSPKIIEDENVEKVKEILGEYFDGDDAVNECVARRILTKFKIPFGKEQTIRLFRDDIKLRRME